MKLYLMTDLEGVAGVYTWENRDDTSLENHERRCRQRRWLAHEVSSAVDGFFAGGATDVIVNDGHGAGYTIVPFVFATGDAHACREMEELIPGIVTVAVKTGTSLFSAIQMPPAEACKAIREGAEQAMKAIGDVEPFKLDSPILFRDERHQPTFDEEKPPEHSRVINAHTREVEAEDIIDLMHKIYDYPKDWKPLEFVPAWRG